jgi:hypothetical protein
MEDSYHQNNPKRGQYIWVSFMNTLYQFSQFIKLHKIWHSKYIAQDESLFPSFHHFLRSLVEKQEVERAQITSILWSLNPTGKKIFLHSLVVGHIAFHIKSILKPKKLNS